MKKRIWILIGLYVALSFAQPEISRAASEGVRFIAVGDTGEGNENQKAVAKLMAEVAKKESISFITLLGDNFYMDGVSSVTDPQWKSKFEDVYDFESLKIPWYVSLGNHDYKGSTEAQIEYGKTHPNWILPRRYYMFRKEIPGEVVVDFIVIDSTPSMEGHDTEQIAWLDIVLRNSRADWKIVYGHHPLYSSGKYSREKPQQSKRMKEVFEPLFVKYGVDLYLSGHEHDLEFYKPQFGIAYAVSGAGATPRMIMPTENSLFVSSDLGFVWLDISKDEIKLAFTVVSREKPYRYVVKKKSAGLKVWDRLSHAIAFPVRKFSR